MQDATRSLVEMSLEWAAKKLGAADGFSLVGMSEDADAVRRGIVVHVKSDADMQVSAREFLDNTHATRFALVGEGTIAVGGTTISVLIVYWQDGSQAQVQLGLMPYTRGEQGEVQLADRMVASDHAPPGSWLPAPKEA